MTPRETNVLTGQEISNFLSITISKEKQHTGLQIPSEARILEQTDQNFKSVNQVHLKRRHGISNRK